MCQFWWEVAPIAGYYDSVCRFEYPKLGDGVFVLMRNPALSPPDMLSSEESGAAGTYEIIARHVKDWLVYDATSEDDEQPLLPLPATAEAVRKLPAAVLMPLVKRLAEAQNPL